MKGLKDQYASLSNDGFRVLAVAIKELAGKTSCTKEDEHDLVLKGYVAFLDPPKPTAATAIEALHKHGVVVKILTGDNDLISRKVCRDVGLLADPMLLGDEVETMSDIELAEAAEQTTLFAALPAHKQRIVRVLRSKGHVVGFMGDGINDSPALRAADIGISVDTAADIAKESADLILLQKDLMVLKAVSSRAGKSSPTFSNTSGWEPAPTLEICSACWEQVPFCHSFPWPQFKF